jgi:hypothetical protein
MTNPHKNTLALRVAGADEAPVVRRLAALDDSPPLDGEVLLALVDGEAVAAVSLDDGRVVANPFLPTADTVTLLSLRASQLTRPPASPQRARIPRLRAA